MIYGIWYVVYGLWYMVYGIWYGMRLQVVATELGPEMLFHLTWGSLNSPYIPLSKATLPLYPLKGPKGSPPSALDEVRPKLQVAPRRLGEALLDLSLRCASVELTASVAQQLP